MKLTLATLIMLASFTLPVVGNASTTLSSEPLVQPSIDQPATSERSAAPSQQNSQVEQWVYIAQDHRQDDAARADALRNLARFPSQNSLVAVVRALQDENMLIREAAIVGAEPYQFAHRWRMIAPLLNDSEWQVRMAATTNLIRDFSNMSSDQQQVMTPPVAELKAYLLSRQDPSSQLLLADVYRWHQEWDKAQVLYEQRLKVEQGNSQIRLSMADNLRAQGLNKQALAVLNNGLEQQPQEANLYYSQALTLVRLEQRNDAAAAMRKAAELAKTNSYFWYLNGVLQENVDLAESTKSFEQAYLISGAPEQLYAVCDIYVRYANEKAGACIDELAKIAPSDVIEELESKRN